MKEVSDRVRLLGSNGLAEKGSGSWQSRYARVAVYRKISGAETRAKVTMTRMA
jgi:hypothetical protein